MSASMIAKRRAIHIEPRPALPSGNCSATSAAGAALGASGCVFSHSSDQQLSASRCRRVSSKPLRETSPLSVHWLTQSSTALFLTVSISMFLSGTPAVA